MCLLQVVSVLIQTCCGMVVFYCLTPIYIFFFAGLHWEADVWPAAQGFFFFLQATQNETNRLLCALSYRDTGKLLSTKCSNKEVILEE